jgi:hypothetical protein
MAGGKSAGKNFAEGQMIEATIEAVQEDFAPSAPAVDLPEVAPPIDIDELVICSDAGDLYHAWQCENTELRINLLEFLAQKAVLLQNAVAVGGFDRAEFIASGSRLVAQMRAEGRVVVRSSLSGTAIAKNEAAPGTGRAATAQVRNKALQWLEEQLTLPGLFAARLLFPDRTGPSHAIPQFTAEAVDLISRCATDGFQVLKLQRFHGQRARWVFEHIVIDCAQWRDGTVLGFVFDRGTLEQHSAALEQSIRAFLKLESG